MSSNDLGESQGYYGPPQTYAALISQLNAFADSSVQKEAVANLPVTDPTGGATLEMDVAEQKALGFANLGTQGTSFASPDGVIGLSSTTAFSYSTNPDQVPAVGSYDFIAATEHEISEVMGRVSQAHQTTYTPMDLFRFASAGTLQLTTADPSYFSINDGVTNLDNWNNNEKGNTGDLGDWAPSAGNDSYLDNSNYGVVNAITSPDVTLMNVLGYHLATPTETPTFPPLVNLLFFGGLDASGQNVLWVSGGTAASTHELIGVNGIAGDLVTPSHMTVFHDKMLFSGTDFYSNAGLWVSDGTATDTYEITGIANASPAGLNPSGMTVFGNEVLFNGTDASGHVGLWETDGSAAGTHEVVAGTAGNSFSATDMTVFHGEVVFAGRDGGLWETDGTAAGTHEITGAAGVSLGALNGTGMVAPPGGLQPYGMAVLNNQLLFGGSAQYQYTSGGNVYTIDTQLLYTFDGTSVQPIYGLAPGGDQAPVRNLIRISNGPIVVSTVNNGGNYPGAPYAPVTKAFFQGDYFDGIYSSMGGGLYATDGTTSGTSPVYGSTPTLVTQFGYPDPTDLTVFGGYLLFNGISQTAAGNGLWVTIGTPGYTQEGTTYADNTQNLDGYITGANASGLGLNPQDMTVFNDNVYFNGSDAAGQQGLWALSIGVGQSPDGSLFWNVLGGELTGISGANSGGINPYDLTALYVPGPTALPLTVGQLLIDLINPSSNHAPAGDAYVITDTAFDIESLTPAEITGGKAIGVAAIVATDASVVFTVAQALALEDPIVVTAPASDTVTILDTTAAIEALSPDQLTALAPIGVIAIRASDASVVLTVAQAVALEGSIVVIVGSGDTVTIVDTVANIEAMTPAEIVALVSVGVTAIRATDGSVVLQPDQARAFADASLHITAPTGDTVTTDYTDHFTAAEIEALTATQIAAIAANGYTTIGSTDTSVALTIAQTGALEGASLHVTTPVGHTVTFADTAAAIEALAAPQIAALSAYVVTTIAATDASVVFTIADAVLLAGASFRVTAPVGHTVTFADTAANIEALTATQITALSGVLSTYGLTALAATDTSVVFTVAEALVLAGAPFHVTAPHGDVVAIAGTPAAIEALTPAQITALPAAGVTEIQTYGYPLITAAQAVALEGAALLVTAEPGSYVYLSIADTAANIAALAPAEITGLRAIAANGYGIYEIKATNASVVFTVAQAVAFAGTSLFMAVPSGDTVTIADTAAHIETLTAAEITALSATVVSAITATDAAVVLTAAQAVALEGVPFVYPQLRITPPPGDTVTIADTAANIEALTPYQLQQLGVIATSATDTSIVFTVAQAEAVVPHLYVTAPVGDTVTIADTAANIESMLASGQLSGVAQFADVTSLSAIDGPVVLDVAGALALEQTNIGTTVTVTAPPGDTVTIADIAADVEAMSAAQMTALTSIGVTAITVTDHSLTLTVAQALALYDPILISVPHGDSVAIVDSESNIDSLTPAQMAGLAAIGVNAIDVSGLTGAGPLTIDAGITLAVSGPVPSNQTITFSGAGGVLALGDTADMNGTVFGFAPPDTIDLTDVAYDPTGSTNLVGVNDLQISENGNTYNLQLDPSQVFLTTPTFILAADTGGGTDVNVVEAPIGGYAVVLFGQTADGVVVASGGEVEVQSGGAVNTGTINSGGLLLIDSGGTSNDAVINSGGLLDLTAGSANGGTITFGTVGGRLEIDDTQMPSATIVGFAVGDTIDLTTITYDPNGNASLQAGNELQISESGVTYNLQLDPSQSFLRENVTFSIDAGGGTEILLLNVTCFAAGTRIATPSGEVAVEALSVGDTVSLAGEGVAEVAWIGHRAVDAARHPAPRKVWPVRISKDAFGAGRPHRDLFLSPDHAVFVENVLIPVKHLINGSTIEQMKVDRITYYHIELACHDVLMAEGLPVESYLDTGDRSNFANGGRPIRLHPEFSGRTWEASGYAPLIVTGPALEAARRRMNALARKRAARAQPDGRPHRRRQRALGPS